MKKEHARIDAEKEKLAAQGKEEKKETKEEDKEAVESEDNNSKEN